jgi:putative transcriptional regulator
MRCTECDAKEPMEKKVLEAYRYKECGLDNIVLHGVTSFRCTKCGEEYIGFGDVEKLHKIIASYIIRKADPLIGAEVRFLRKHMGYSGAVFARLVGYESEHLSRIENGKSPVQTPFDQLIRMMIAKKHEDREYSLHDLFLEGKAMKAEWLEFSLKGNEWEYAEAA